MFKTCVLTLILLTFISPFAQPKSTDFKIGSKNYESIIFDSSKAEMIYKNKYGSYWNPNQIEIELYEKTLIQYLKDNEDTEVEFIHEKCTLKLLTDLKYYRCQYSGVIIDGKRYLNCHYFYYRKDYEDLWETYLIEIKDGGIMIWDVMYNVEDKKIESLKTNGVG